MFYVVECMQPIVYDWSTTLLSNMKQQLNDYKMGWVRNFEFGSILSTFFFERVPGLSARVDIVHMKSRIQLSDARIMSCADWGVVGWLNPTKQSSSHGGRDRS